MEVKRRVRGKEEGGVRERRRRGRKGNLGVHIQILYATTSAGMFIQMYTLLL